MFHHRPTRKKQKSNKKISKSKTRQKAAKRLFDNNRSKTPSRRVKRVSGITKANRNRQVRLNKTLQSKIAKSMKQSIPKICVVLPLAELNFENQNLANPQNLQMTEETKHSGDFHKTAVKFLKIDRNCSFLSIIDSAKVADLILLEITLNESILFTESFRANIAPLAKFLANQGLPDMIAVVKEKEQGEAETESHKKVFSKKLKVLLKEMFGKAIPVEFDKSEKLKLYFKNLKHCHIAWRSARPHLLAEEVRVVANGNSQSASPFATQKVEVGITGHLRGDQRLDIRHKAHLTGIGTFEISRVLFQGSPKPPLENFSEAVERDAEMATFGEEHKNPENDPKTAALLKRLKITPGECANRHFEMETLKLDFPDEVATPVDTPARLRFRKFRGLQSLAKSPWTGAEQPFYAEKLHFFRNYAAAAKAAVSGPQRPGAAAERFSVAAGQFVEVVVRMDKEEAAELARRWAETRFPLVLSGLFEHEDMRSIVHYKLKKVAKNRSVESKSKFTFHCGFRRFEKKPIFSAITHNCDKSLLQKELRDGQFALASVVGPISMARDPVTMTAPLGAPLETIAAGRFEAVNPNQTVLKRVLLTGYPIKINKAKAVVRFMFFSPLDVKWFSSVELRTKGGLTGRIKESVGTHGHMKCVFSDFVKSNDIVCLPLYKRVFPLYER